MSLELKPDRILASEAREILKAIRDGKPVSAERARRFASAWIEMQPMGALVLGVLDGGLLAGARLVELAEKTIALHAAGGPATRSKAPLEVVLGAMGSQARQVLEAALALPKEERAELAAKILASVGRDDTNTDPDVDAAWAEEITRRAEQALSGESKGSPWKAVQEEARDMLGRK